MKQSGKLKVLSNDVITHYKEFRTQGKGRCETVSIIREMFFNELQDDDDKIDVLIGLSLALCQKNELTELVALETRDVINCALKNTLCDSTTAQFYEDIIQMLNDESYRGDEAPYRRRMPYKPQWEVGDLFCHTLTFPQAALLGIDGWTILFYKVGEYLNCTGKHIQLMYVSLCAPGKEPVTGAELNDIGFLRMMRHDNTWDYMVQMKIKSKRDELNYGLTKIGHFNDVTLPADRTEENPLVAMPFFGRLRKDDAYPSYEDQVCRLYRAFGKKALGK